MALDPQLLVSLTGAGPQARLVWCGQVLGLLTLDMMAGVVLRN